MVSFQCDGCQEVVKKPKLDNHSYKCQASFTCVDCSKTFNVPAEWKGHTSCVSEAEKYQKGLYKGKKNQNGSGGPRGARSGAVESASKYGAEKNLPEDKTVKETTLQLKGNFDSPVAEESTKEDIQEKKLEGEKKKKKKKRKANEIEDTSANEAVPNKVTKATKRQDSDGIDDRGKVKADEETNTDDIPLSVTSLSEKEKKEKKNKKNKKNRVDGADSSQTGGPPEADVRPSSTSAAGKNDAEEVRFLGNGASDEAPIRKEKSKSKKEKSEAVLSSQKESLGTETGEADKKRKRSESEGGEETSTHETKKGKKERRRKEKKRKAEIVEGSETATS